MWGEADHGYTTKHKNYNFMCTVRNKIFSWSSLRARSFESDFVSCSQVQEKEDENIGQ